MLVYLFFILTFILVLFFIHYVVLMSFHPSYYLFLYCLLVSLFVSILSLYFSIHLKHRFIVFVLFHLILFHFVFLFYHSHSIRFLHWVFLVHPLIYHRSLRNSLYFNRLSYIWFYYDKDIFIRQKKG